jgi:hypothetical protein
LVRSVDRLLIGGGLGLELAVGIRPVEDINWGVMSRLVDMFWYYSIVMLAGLLCIKQII